jgi:diadenosine tetraphosphate (Ap4A) HIT family hydrolase
LKSESFILHEQLATDTLVVGDWQLCRLLRMNDRTYPWLILVPRRPEIREIIDLGNEDQHQLMTEIGTASHALRQLHAPDKINVAALGNMVPQLHVHVIARFTSDPAWPRPIWGVQPAEPFATAADAKHEIDRWQTVLRLPQ